MKNIENSNAVENSNGINWSKGINDSNGINWSNGINLSSGINGSKGINDSNGINGSDGINLSSGINWSNGINLSSGINGSYGILNSYGVDNALFLADKKRTFSIFGVEVSQSRFEEVWDELHTKLNGWYPKFNNAFELYLKVGSDWKKVNANQISGKLNNWEEPYEAWKDMPKEAIEYVKSLPEFNAVMFKRITGIDVEKNTLSGKTVKVEIDGESYEAVIK